MTLTNETNHGPDVGAGQIFGAIKTLDDQANRYAELRASADGEYGKYVNAPGAVVHQDGVIELPTDDAAPTSIWKCKYCGAISTDDNISPADGYCYFRPVGGVGNHTFRRVK